MDRFVNFCLLDLVQHIGHKLFCTQDRAHCKKDSTDVYFVGYYIFTQNISALCM
ncbi:hypothetical protein Bpfe_014232, partial [Biomphalaria pfeifferi]